MADAKRDKNYVTTFMGVDLSTLSIPTPIVVDETNNRLLVSAQITSTQVDFDTLIITYATGASKISDDLANLLFKLSGVQIRNIAITNTGTDEDTLVYS